MDDDQFSLYPIPDAALDDRLGFVLPKGERVCLMLTDYKRSSRDA